MIVALRTAVLIAISGVLIPAAAGQEPSVEGRLVVEAGKSSVIEAEGKTVPLTSSRRSVRDTLHDTRISGKRIKAIGTQNPDGTFDVDEFYVVQPDGALYRLVYFCNVCNITRFGPGKCSCCQQPTIPTEIPQTDPRVRKN
jgi:hypothetical protein